LDGKPLPNSFERSIGYVQQLNVELETATVREALRFSALMRQPRSVRKEEKFEFVERVIAALGMEDFAEAVVGVPGHGLAVNQRKLLSIGIELAARPSVLLFLDEPTTGLDAQSAFSVVRFLRYLTKHGVCVLCTIHQPSSVIFEHFDRLLLLVEGGKTAYFGEIGQDAQTVTQYFEGNGARIYDPTENPAEFLIDVASGSEDWNQIWKSSKEFVSVEAELGKIKSRTPSHGSHFEASHPPEDGDHEEDSRQYALPLLEQCYHVTFRVFQQYWRTPTYVWAKIVLAVASSA
jgi:ABC-type multidrug transport system ATPase subunit